MEVELPKPLFPWMGGKSRLANRIIPLLPEHTCYVEPFAGAAGLLFKKEPSKSEVLNDINGDIINLFRVVQNHLDEFVSQFRWSLTSRTMFKWLEMSEPETLTDIQRAARFYYLQRLSFGGKTHGRTYGVATTTGPKLNLLRVEEELSAAHIRLCRVNIERLDWFECIKRYDRPHTVFYCDPPYWQTADYGETFGFENYERMSELARSIQGRMLISINNHPDIRRVFRGLECREFDLTYRINGSMPAKKVKELLFIT